MKLCKCGNKIDSDGMNNPSNAFLDQMCWDCFQKGKIEAEEQEAKDAGRD